MSQADVIFKNMCEDILANGTDNKGEAIRPHWEDGTPAYTLARFGVTNRYDLAHEFPALTFRKVAFKTCIDELLWIWQKQSANINDLKGHIWDSWADESGSIGKAYGYQQSKKHFYPDVSEAGIEAAFGDLKDGHTYAVKERRGERDGYLMTQLDKAIYDLKNTPFSRRIIVSMWDPEDQYEMHLAPCAYEMTFMVTRDEEGEGLVLNGILNQRSNDLLAAGNWNVVQYSVLIYMLAHICGMKAGELLHVIGNAHIYDRHIDMIKELISREQFPAPVFEIKRKVSSFYDFTVDDFELKDYNYGPQIKNIPVAI